MNRSVLINLLHHQPKISNIVLKGQMYFTGTRDPIKKEPSDCPAMSTNTKLSSLSFFSQTKLRQSDLMLPPCVSKWLWIFSFITGATCTVTHNTVEYLMCLTQKRNKLKSCILGNFVFSPLDYKGNSSSELFFIKRNSPEWPNWLWLPLFIKVNIQ